MQIVYGNSNGLSRSCKTYTAFFTFARNKKLVIRFRFKRNNITKAIARFNIENEITAIPFSVKHGIFFIPRVKPFKVDRVFIRAYTADVYIAYRRQKRTVRRMTPFITAGHKLVRSGAQGLYCDGEKL